MQRAQVQLLVGELGSHILCGQKKKKGIISIMSLEPKTFFSSTPNCLECHHTIMSSKFYCKEMEVRTLGWEDPLEKKMATHSSILAWDIPWTKEPGGLQSMRVTKRWTRLSDSTTATIVVLSRCLSWSGRATILLCRFYSLCFASTNPFNDLYDFSLLSSTSGSLTWYIIFVPLSAFVNSFQLGFLDNSISWLSSR